MPRKYTKRKDITTENAAVESNYKFEYERIGKELGAAQNKIAEYEKIIKAYAVQLQESRDMLKKAMLEYNSRCEYMLDAVKHAYLSIQIAYTNSKGDKND